MGLKNGVRIIDTGILLSLGIIMKAESKSIRKCYGFRYIYNPSLAMYRAHELHQDHDDEVEGDFYENS